MSRFISFLLILYTVCFTLAQSSEQNRPALATKAGIDKKLHELGEKDIKDPKEKERILRQLKTASESIGYDKATLKCGSDLMVVIGNQGRRKEVIELGDQLKKISYNKADIDYADITNIYRMNALALNYTGLSDEALKDYKTAMDFAKKIENDDKKFYLLALLYENVTGIYMSKRFENNNAQYKRYNDSILSGDIKSLSTIKKVKDNNPSISNNLKYDLIVFINIRLGIYYLEQANVAGNVEKAEKYLLDGLSIYKKNNSYLLPGNVTFLMNQLSWLYSEKKDFKTSIAYAKHAMEQEKKHSDPYDRVESFEFLASSYLEIGEKEKSKFYMSKYTNLKDSLAFAQKNDANATVTKMSEEVNESSKKQFIIIGFLFLLFSAAVIVLWKRKNRTMRRNYEQMIVKLKNETTQSSTVSEEYVLPEAFVQKNVIADETERKLLKKLENFEASENFLRKDIAISSLSHQWSTNPKYLSDIIKKYRAQNFSQYINNLKINYIVHKLYNDYKFREYKISYLAEVCGFASSQVFVIAFKKVNGMPPSYFIQSLKDDQFEFV